MQRPSAKLLISSAMAIAFGTTSAHAENPNYAPGDLVLFFQQTFGTKTVYANLGNAATIYRGTTAGPGAADRIDFLNINAEMVSAFGAGWAMDPTIHAGLAGVWGTSQGSSGLQDQDPHRTLYVSSPRNGVGTLGTADSTGWDLTLAGNTAMNSGAVGIEAQNNILEIYSTATAVSPVGISTIDDQNPFEDPSLAIQAAAFQGAFSGGVQQAGMAGTFGSLGAAGTVEFALDLYRVLARTGVSGQVAGALRVGSFEGTVTLSTSGKVSFLSQGAAGTSFDSWALTFPALDTPTKRLPSADPDNDGFNNLAEFVLNGNPSVSGQALAPTLDASGSNFVFSFTRRDDSESEAPVVFQYGSDLATWTDVAVGATSGTVGAATVGVTEGGTVTDAITVSVPKTVAVGGKLFGRIKMVK